MMSQRQNCDGSGIRGGCDPAPEVPVVIVGRGEQVGLDPVQSGFAHGFGIFETIKLSGGRLCFWSRHWSRMARSAVALGLDWVWTEAQVRSAAGELLRKEGVSDGVLKLSLVRGTGAGRLFVYMRPFLPAASPARLFLESRFPVNERSPLAGHKTHNYMENLLVLEGARAAGFYDAIRLNTQGMLAETSVANLFFISGGTLCTPALECGCLPGVVREALLEIGGVEERVAGPGLLEEAEAVFVTNSSIGLLPVERIEAAGGRVVFEGDSAAHPRLRSLRDALDQAEGDSAVSA